MILRCFAIFDRVAGFYAAPFYLASKGEAIRAFSDLAMDPNTAIFRHPGDYALFELGVFDNETGRSEFLAVPEHLANAGQVAALRQAPDAPPEALQTSLEGV